MYCEEATANNQSVFNLMSLDKETMADFRTLVYSKIVQLQNFLSYQSRVYHESTDKEHTVKLQFKIMENKKQLERLQKIWREIKV